MSEQEEIQCRQSNKRFRCVPNKLEEGRRCRWIHLFFWLFALCFLLHTQQAWWGGASAIVMIWWSSLSFQWGHATPCVFQGARSTPGSTRESASTLPDTTSSRPRWRALAHMEPRIRWDSTRYVMLGCCASENLWFFGRTAERGSWRRWARCLDQSDSSRSSCSALESASFTTMPSEINHLKMTVLTDLLSLTFKKPYHLIKPI